MRYLEIAGGRPLSGEITIQGSKNAALPILAACLLGEGPCVIENCPCIQDVEDTLTILRALGCQIRRNGAEVTVNAKYADQYAVIGTEAARIRSSVLFLGALLGKMGKAKIPYPGGCAIGSRPIDLHLKALKELGASFSDSSADGLSSQKYILAHTKGLRGSGIHLAVPSVGATENTILAAVLADGETEIRNAALEPEVKELCQFLVLRGADIRLKEDGRLFIQGKNSLSPVKYRLGADRIVAGSYLLAAAACGGTVVVSNLPVHELGALLCVLRQMGITVLKDGTLISDASLNAVEYLETAPYPGFPTDLQSPLMAALSTAHGNSTICETVFENRFKTAAQLCKMGARIQTEGNCALIEGKARLHGASVTAPDLRGGAALIGAALTAQGNTIIRGYDYIARGYEDICRDLKSLGADIRLREQ